jgi:Uma2 family endonuclease
MRRKDRAAQAQGGHEMGGAAVVTGKRATLQEYLELPGEFRAEFVHGVVLVNPPPSFAHQRSCLRLRDVLVAHLPLAVVAVAVGWKLQPDRDDVRIPDVCVLPHEPDTDLLTTPPLVVVEVLSSNRSDDLVRKSTEYLEAGAGQYWIIDPRDHVLDAFLNTPTGWEVLAHLTDDNPSGTVEVPGLGRVPLDLTQILV